MTLHLDPGVIHLYWALPDEIKDPQLLSNYQALLSAEEQARWERFYFARHRHQYLVTRALIRSTLSRYIDKSPTEWRFSVNAYGRPEIVRTANEPPLRFNLSHTDGLILCAVVLGADIGVDVEDLTRNNATLDIARRYFSPQEIADLNRTEPEERRTRFFTYWTLKEAYIKARGMGLALPLNQFSFHIDHNQTVRIAFDPRLSDKPQHWQFWRFQPSVNHCAAVAVKSETGLQYQLTLKQVVPLNE